MTFPNASRFIRSAAAALVTLAAACSDSSGPGSGDVTVVLRRSSTAPALSETGQTGGSRTPAFAVEATPVSCPFQEAVFTIEEIYLQGEGGRTTLRSEPATVDLCDLGNQALLLVNEIEVPAGTYQQLRFVISGGYLQTSDGSVYATAGYDLPAELEPADGTLQTPSWDASGLKVDFSEPLTVQGGQSVIALEIDVAQSFGQLAGASGQWVMSPVIQAADISFSGSVLVRLALASGVTLPEVGGTQITFGDFDATATLGSTSVVQAFDPALGETVFFLPPDASPYEIVLGVPSTLNVTSSPASHSVTIEEGVEAAPVTFTLEAVTVK
jgi:hypothetical protein